MKFTKVPGNFAPLPEGVVFEFDTELAQPANVVAKIRNGAGEVIGRQRICNVIRGAVDAAPYLRHLLAQRPFVAEGSAVAEAPVERCSVEIEGVRSPEVTVAGNLLDVIPQVTLSTMPLHRRIAHGEHDEIRVFGTAGTTIRIRIKTDAGDDVSFEQTVASGAAICRFDTADISPEARSAEVSILSKRTTLATFYYTVGRRYVSDVRLAWLSEAGTIERYTFPIVRNVERSVVKKRVGRADAWLDTVECQSELCVRLVSDYERREVAAALAAIVSSPCVWSEYGDILTPADVISSSSTLYALGRPDCVELDLRLQRKEAAI